jgi:hypothetical protein
VEQKTVRKINTLHNWEHNPRSVTKQGLERLKKQLTKHGQYKPLLVTEDGTVLGGNMRLVAMKELGWEDIWVSVVEADTEEERIEYALSDNDRVGQYDGEQLANMVGNFPSIEWSDFAVDIEPPTIVSDLADKYKESVEDEPPAVSQEEPVSKLGEIYQVGRHRVMCGDSTDAGSVALLMNGHSADMVFTDPPYGVDYSSRVDEERRKGWGGIKNDELKGPELQAFLQDSLSIHKEKSLYVCCNWQSVVDFFTALGKPNALIVWDKESIGLGAGYRNQHEFILFYGKLDHNGESNIWRINRDITADYAHPTQKPIYIYLQEQLKTVVNKTI